MQKLEYETPLLAWPILSWLEEAEEYQVGVHLYQVTCEPASRLQTDTAISRPGVIGSLGRVTLFCQAEDLAGLIPLNDVIPKSLSLTWHKTARHQSLQQLRIMQTVSTLNETGPCDDGP